MALLWVPTPNEMAIRRKPCWDPPLGGPLLRDPPPMSSRLCACYPAVAHREFAHRSIASVADGREHLLFAHSDVWLNLKMFARALGPGSVGFGPNTTLSPERGLQGADMSSSLRTRCLTLEQLDAEVGIPRAPPPIPNPLLLTPSA